jgi:hypothetical protein
MCYNRHNFSMGALGSMTKYIITRDGDTILLKGKKCELKAACCDCNLTHVYKFHIIGDLLKIKVTRDDRATGQLRRWAKRKKSKK